MEFHLRDIFELGGRFLLLLLDSLLDLAIQPLGNVLQLLPQYLVLLLDEFVLIEKGLWIGLGGEVIGVWLLGGYGYFFTSIKRLFRHSIIICE